MKRKQLTVKLIAFLLIAAVLAPVTPARAAGTECAVIGADLTNAQTEEVYAAFGIPRGSVQELMMTNDEERSYLEGYVDESVIGTASISCVYIRLLDEGSGTQVSAENVTWCDEEMYRAALETAGITDVQAIIAAPFAVSGTAALAGIYKAYETLTGQTLDEIAKQVGVQELTLTADLADQLGSVDASAIVGDLKSILTETASMTDEELRTQIRAVAEQYGVTLNDAQVRQLLNLCRRLEGLSESDLVEKIEDLQSTAKKISEAGEKVEEARRTLSAVVNTVKSVITRVGEFFSGLFNRKK
ncbi:MAG: DUF1002 domain-containing protein [Oscillospiraceae bacterium]|nr:DUF1002 domain-containing protein [Oscillospiraceae bacterium]